MRFFSSSNIRTFVRNVAASCAAASVVAAAGSPAGAIVYAGKPDLPLTASMITAGGGPVDFSAPKLLGVIAGPLVPAEVAKLDKQFGKASVNTSLAIFDFSVQDAARIVTAAHIALPAPAPAPADGHALGVALYRAGLVSGSKWDVGYMLEHLITHPVHHAVMMDIDKKFGAADNETFHIVLAQLMHDLAVAYSRT